jgi:LL-diaminopimelate aminotransferase
MSQDQLLPPPADRVRKLPPYIFATVFQMRDAALAAGRKVFDLGVGNPDGRPSASVQHALVRALDDEHYNCHRYCTFNGLPRLREAIADWYFERFGVTLEPNRETLPLIGSKEGLANLMRAYLNKGDTIILPSPCYPAYFGAARLCETRIHEMPLVEEDGFLPRLADIPGDVALQAKMLVLNYPNNPTGGVCEQSFYEDAVAFCREHEIMLVSDIPYSELSLDKEHVPGSVLEVAGARDVAVEFQSLSKSHNMAGWRVGMAVGNAEVLATLLKLKSNVDFSLFGAVQMAAVEALGGSQKICADNRALYRRRRDIVIRACHDAGWMVPVPRATMYVWSRIPRAYGGDEFAFVKDLFDRTGVLLTPGSGFGTHGRGYVRMSLALEDEDLAEAMDLLRGAEIDWTI